MITSKGISIFKVLRLTWHHLLWLSVFMSFIAFLYYSKVISLTIPWLPVSVIGTAVAFYVGFKNNQSYDRMWEARKIWGGIVNDSRAWGMMVDGFISNLETKNPLSNEELNAVKKRLIYRHISWLYAHRAQLLIPTEWEHSKQKGVTGKFARKLISSFEEGIDHHEYMQSELKTLLQENEYNQLLKSANTATQIINNQSRDLANLRELKVINDFQHIEMIEVLRSFYAYQGKNERIKKFPLPRQYANMSIYFVGIFIFLLPFSMIPEISSSMQGWGVWLSIPISVLIGWVYIMMELVGDYSENPFQGMMNDIPMLSLCRVIEIDLKQMLNETDLPPSIQSKNGILM